MIINQYGEIGLLLFAAVGWFYPFVNYMVDLFSEDVKFMVSSVTVFAKLYKQSLFFKGGGVLVFFIIQLIAVLVLFVPDINQYTGQAIAVIVIESIILGIFALIILSIILWFLVNRLFSSDNMKKRRVESTNFTRDSIRTSEMY